MPFPSKTPNPPRHKIKYSPIKVSKDNSYNLNTSANLNYITQLEEKITIQSKHISELEKYKFLCEKFIQKMNPY